MAVCQVFTPDHKYYITFVEPAFDPKPFIRSFEEAVDRLISVRKEIQTKTEQMEKSVRVSEREYSKKMTELTKGFEVSRHVVVSGISSSYQSTRLSEIRSQAWKVV
jgi:hypothetical protein